MSTLIHSENDVISLYHLLSRGKCPRLPTILHLVQSRPATLNLLVQEQVATPTATPVHPLRTISVLLFLKGFARSRWVFPAPLPRQRDLALPSLCKSFVYGSLWCSITFWDFQQLADCPGTTQEEYYTKDSERRGRPLRSSSLSLGLS